VILKLLALFTIVPLIELALLIPLGMRIGLWPTIGLVVGTALLGAFLGKSEGTKALDNIKRDLNEGELPADSLLDGLAVLVAGIFLVTPGVLTDVVALILLIPPARKPLRAIARKRFEKMLSQGSMTYISAQTSRFDSVSQGGASPFGSPFGGPPPGQGDIIDVTPDGDDQEPR
jgi:UPF0716 protein FxsA